MADQWTDVPASDTAWQDISSPKFDFKSTYMQGASDVQNLLSKAMTGASTLLTGKSITDRLLPQYQQNIPQATTAPFDANVQKASNPVNQAMEILKGADRGMANTVGNFTENNLTSPLSLLASTAGIIKATPTQNILSKLNPFGNKIKSDYVDSTIFPKAQEIFSNTLNKFEKPVQNYLVDKGVPQSAVDHIANRTTATVKNMAAGAENTDPVVMRIQSDIAAKDAAVGKAYSDAMAQVPDNAAIATPNTSSVMEDFLKKYKFLKPDGTPDARSLFPDANPVLKNVNNLYDTIKIDSFAVNKYQWSLLRGELSKIRGKDSTLSGDITKMLDALHTDAESAGISGISNARNMARENFQNQDLFTKFNQTKLDNIFKQKGQDLRDLQQLGKYTGTDYENMAKDIVANKYLTNIQSIAEKPSLGNQNPALYSIIRKATDNPSTFKQNSKLITDFTGNSKDSAVLLKQIKTLNRNEFIRKAILGTGGATIGLSLLNNIAKGVVNPAAKQISEAVGMDNQ